MHPADDTFLNAAQRLERAGCGKQRLAWAWWLHCSQMAGSLQGHAAFCHLRKADTRCCSSNITSGPLWPDTVLGQSQEARVALLMAFDEQH